MVWCNHDAAEVYASAGDRVHMECPECGKRTHDGGVSWHGINYNYQPPRKKIQRVEIDRETGEVVKW